MTHDVVYTTRVVRACLAGLALVGTHNGPMDEPILTAPNERIESIGDWRLEGVESVGLQRLRYYSRQVRVASLESAWQQEGKPISTQ